MKFSWLTKNNKKSWAALATLSIVALAILVMPHIVQAESFSTGVAKIIGHGVAAIIWLLGKVLVVLMSIVVWVAQYNAFIKAPAVSAGWQVVRDICNMFFILILLIIAFSTVLNVKTYYWKSALPKLIIMAVLINFSKLLCGVVIDFAQVVMLTFVNGFRDIAGGNLADMAGIMNLLNINAESGDVGVLALTGTYILALLYILAALVVIGVILGVLVMRIIMLWILVVLSPLACLLSSNDGTKKYAGQWTSQFTNNVVAGPILAFFIWLSFASLQQADIADDKMFGPEPAATGNEQQYRDAIPGAATPGSASAGLAEAGTMKGMLKFIVSMGMLIGGLIITKQLGGTIGDIAGKGLGAIGSGAKSVTGFNAINDRIKAFNKNRDAARGEKISASGAKWYGRYASLQGGIKGAATGTVRGAKGMVNDLGSAVGKTLVEKIAQSNNQRLKAATAKVMAIPAGVRGFKQGIVDSKKERRAHRDRMRAAYVNKEYKDEHGNTFKEQWENGQTFYTRNVNGRTQYATNKKGNVITKMSAMAYKADQAWTKSMMDSRAFNNKKGKEQAEKERDKMANAGMTADQLLGVLEDSSSRSSTKIAAALAVAAKEAFKNRDQVSGVQNLLTNLNNPLMTKQFNDDVNKKQAHLNFNLADAEERKKFSKLREDGKFEVLQSGAYEDANVIQAFSENMTDKEFIKYIEKVNGYSKKHSESAEKGIKLYVSTQNPPIDPATNKVDKSRKVAPKITHNLNDAVRGIKDPTEMYQTLNKVFESLSLGDIAHLKSDSFKADKDLKPEIQAAYGPAIRQIIKENITPDNLKSLKSNKDADRETVKKIERIINGEADTDDSTSNPNPGSTQQNTNQSRGQNQNQRRSGNANSAGGSSTRGNRNDDIEDAKFVDLDDEDEESDQDTPSHPPLLNP